MNTQININNNLVEEIADLTVIAMDVSIGLFADLESLAEHYQDGELSEDQVRDQLEQIRSDISTACEE